MAAMLPLAVIWFVLLASSPGQCWSDARFSKVRQMSAKQYQEGYKVLTTSEDDSNPEMKTQLRSSRPLFSWDFASPNPEVQSALSETISMPLVENLNLSRVKVAAPSGNMGRKKNRNKKKHFSHKKSGSVVTNQTQLIDSDDKELQKGIRKHHFHVHNTHLFSEEETGNVNRVRESFRLTKERKRKNKHRKERTGKRKSKSERRKGERNRKRDDIKLKRKGRKQKDNNVISNSLPNLANDNFQSLKQTVNSENIKPMQVDSKNDPVNEILPNDVSTTKRLNKANNRQFEAIVNNNMADNNYPEHSVSERPDNFEVNGIKDNMLLPILHLREVDGGKQALKNSMNGTNQIKSSRDKSYISLEESKLTNLVSEEFINNSLPIDAVTNDLHGETYGDNKVLPVPFEHNMTLEMFNELLPKDNVSSRSSTHTGNISGSNTTTQLEEKETNSLEGAQQNFTADLTCLSGTFLPAPPMPGAAIKYIRTQASPVLQSTAYLIAEYKCHSLYHLRDPSINQLVCSKRQWAGVQPLCVPDEEMKIHRKDCGELKGECDHICEIISGIRVCSCYRGFRLDGNTCKDINECEFVNGGCESGCLNTLGSYHCVCPLGLRLADDGKTCLDINECLLRNGHGPCQDSCVNHWASYECSCEGIPGTRLSADNHTCEDVDECADGTAGCSHTCLNTLGSAFCLCPAGFMLGDDWKTCQDINECAYEDLQTEHCELGCVNTIGSYHCLEKEEDSTNLQQTATEMPVSCPDGMRQKIDGSCVDINECEEKISGCTQSCLNTNGSFQCICGLGYSLSSDNKTCVESAEETVCPPLDSPVHGYLECTRHLVRMKKSRYPWLKRTRVVNHAGSVCQLKCPHGYVMEGEYRKTCGQDKRWTGPENGSCVPLPSPSIRCPSNMTLTLKPGKSVAYVTIPQPVTNVNWYRFVEATPSWGKSLEANLPPGHWEVKYTARHPTSHLTTSCILTISVLSES